MTIAWRPTPPADYVEVWLLRLVDDDGDADSDRAVCWAGSDGYPSSIEATLAIREAARDLRCANRLARALADGARAPGWLRDAWCTRHDVTASAPEPVSHAAGPLAIAVALWDLGYSWAGIASALGAEPRCALDERWRPADYGAASLGQRAWEGRAAGFAWRIVGAALRMPFLVASSHGAQYARRHGLWLPRGLEVLHDDGRVTWAVGGGLVAKDAP